MSVENKLDSSTSNDGGGHKEPSQTNLDYYAKPENYQGSNLQTISRFVYTTQKEEREKHTENKATKHEKLKSMYDRYADICDETLDCVDFSDVYTRIPGVPHSQTITEILLNKQTHVKGKYQLRSLADRSQSTDGVQSIHISEEAVNGENVKTPIQHGYIHNTKTSLCRNSDAIRKSSVVCTPPDGSIRSFRLDSISSVSDIQRKISVTGPYRAATTSVTNITANHINLMLAKERFRHAIKIVLILLKWISTLTEKEDEDGKIKGGKTFTDIASEAFEAGKIKTPGIAFDVSQFKARKEMSISNEVKHILSIPSEARTPDQLQTVLFGLQHLKSFAEYPLHMQEKLCKVAWFQHVPHKKVIIRQGHFAENFYFILSGQAVVRILEKNPKSGEVSLRTAAVMRKGTSFGELALLHRSRRTATVVSQDNVQLLSIGREDFLDIFMSRTSGPDEIPDHIQFIAHLDFLQGWPIEKLMERPECCLFHFFKRGVVIVKDSNQSEWLYIVKSGSCQVMKRLKGVRPHTTNPRSKGGSLSARDDDSHRKLPKLDSFIIPEPKIDSGRQKKNKTLRIASPVLKAMAQYEALIQQKEDELKITSQKPLNDEDESDMKDETNLTPRTKPATDTINTSQILNVSVKPGFSKSKFSRFPKPKPANLPVFNSSQSSAVSSAITSLRKSQSAKFSRQPMDKPSSKENKQPPPQEEDLGPVFVQVEKLKPRDIFGLSSVHFDDTIEDPGTSVSLVSNGAECIMLSKKFFITHASEITKKNVRHMVHPYPSEESLQHNLQTKVDWDVYKRHLVNHTMVSINVNRSLDRKSNLPDIWTPVK